MADGASARPEETTLTPRATLAVLARHDVRPTKKATRDGVCTAARPRNDVRCWLTNPHRGPRENAEIVRDLVRDRAA